MPEFSFYPICLYLFNTLPLFFLLSCYCILSLFFLSPFLSLSLFHLALHCAES